MFGHAYFGAPYFGPPYWGPGSGGPAPTISIDRLGGRRRHPDEVRREQRMVAEYLRSLEQREPVAVQEVPAIEEAPAAPVIVELTAAMAKAASDHQIQRIVEAAAATERAREIARAEHKWRYWAAFLTLVMH